MTSLNYSDKKEYISGSLPRTLSNSSTESAVIMHIIGMDGLSTAEIFLPFAQLYAHVNIVMIHDIKHETG
jgi:hypothetical protein